MSQNIIGESNMRNRAERRHNDHKRKNKLKFAFKHCFNQKYSDDEADELARLHRDHCKWESRKDLKWTNPKYEFDLQELEYRPLG